MKFSARLPAIYFFFSLPVIYCQDRVSHYWPVEAFGFLGSCDIEQQKILSDMFQKFAEETNEREGSFFRKPTHS
uniref:Secreted protein n=1 Tax=Steinernema glaseri TaxID=37863 RepID=A0A1I8A3T4_9BILA